MFILTKRQTSVPQRPFQEPVPFNIHINDPEELTGWILSKFANDNVGVREKPILLRAVLPSKWLYTGLQEPYDIHKEQIRDLAPGKEVPLAAIQANNWLQEVKLHWDGSGNLSRQHADHKPPVCPASRGPKASLAGLTGIQPVKWEIAFYLRPVRQHLECCN